MARPKQHGFTLMELMVVVVVVAILAAIAIPSYMGYLHKSRRTDAHAALLDTAQRLERCYSQYNRFDHDDCPVALPAASPEGFYTVSGTINANSYSLTATPPAGSPQASDVDCATLTINQLNQRGATGSDTSKCW